MYFKLNQCVRVGGVLGLEMHVGWEDRLLDAAGARRNAHYDDFGQRFESQSRNGRNFTRGSGAQRGEQACDGAA